MSDRSPTEIGKYHIQELIGEGAMGVVYRATDSVLGRTVAIKVMSASIARQEDLRQRFLREAQAAGSLQHPNVVTIYDLGEIDGHLFIAMEYVHGTDLERLIELAEPLKLQTKLDIVVDVLTGLAYAHKRGIVHRDIKPANIRVGDDGRAKIMDFGVAHLASSSITKTGLVVGTPSYMAPEQVMGGKAIAETDIFAVGAVLYQLLTGEKPFEAPTLQSLFYKIVTDMPKPVTDMMPGLAPALDRITAKALAKDPTQRYHNALEMANEITRVRSQLSGAPMPATISLETVAVTEPEKHLDPPSRSLASAAPSATASAASTAPAPALVTTASGSVPTRKTPTMALMGAAAVAVVAIGWLVFGRDGNADTGSPAVPAAVTADTPSAVASAPAESLKTVASAPGVATKSAPPAEEPKPQPVEAKATPRVTPPAPTRPVLSAAERRRQMMLERAEKRGEATRTTAKPPLQKPIAPRVTAQSPVVTGSPTIASSPIVAAPPPRQTIAPQTPPELPRPAVTESKPETAAAKTESAASEVASVVAAYARAIESRDVAAVKRAYPGMTAEQARGFGQFFEAARSINVTFRVAGLETNGNTAEARLVGTYEYVTSGSRTERQPVSFAATFRNDGSSWRLVSVR
jgi:serine/threonine-protein kinase